MKISDDYGVEAIYEYNNSNQVSKNTIGNSSEYFEYNDNADLTKSIDAKGKCN